MVSVECPPVSQPIVVDISWSGDATVSCWVNEDGAGLQEERGGTVRPTPDLVGGGGNGRRPGGAGVPASGGKDGRVVLAWVRLVEEDGGFTSASATTSEA